MNKLYNLANDDIICSLATVPGTSAIALIRISGKGCIELVNSLFRPLKKKTNLVDARSHTIHFGKLVNNDEIIDEVLISVFIAPNSYTSEDIIDSKKGVKESPEEDAIVGEDSAIDPAIIEDTFIEEFSEYNDVDNF